MFTSSHNRSYGTLEHKRSRYVTVCCLQGELMDGLAQQKRSRGEGGFHVPVRTHEGIPLQFSPKRLFFA